MHSFVTNVNHIFNSKLAIYHLCINNIEEDRIPTSYNNHQGQRRARALESPVPNQGNSPKLSNPNFFDTMLSNLKIRRRIWVEYVKVNIEKFEQ